MTASLRKQFQLSHEAMDLGEKLTSKGARISRLGECVAVNGECIGKATDETHLFRSKVLARDAALQALIAASRIIAEIDGEEE